MNDILKSEQNLYKTKGINANKKIYIKTNDKIFDDFSNISEIKKTNNSFEEQNINPDYNMPTFFSCVLS